MVEHASPVPIPNSHRDLLTDPRSLTVLVTLMPDGQPQAQVVWVDVDGDTVIVNTERSRQKAKNLARNPKVTLLSTDPANSERYIEIRGEVESMSEADGVEVINQLAMKYDGQPYFGGRAPVEALQTMRRVTVRIRPTRIVTRG